MQDELVMIKRRKTFRISNNTPANPPPPLATPTHPSFPLLPPPPPPSPGGEHYTINLYSKYTHILQMPSSELFFPLFGEIIEDSIA